jgi:hypothetical protein
MSGAIQPAVLSDLERIGVRTCDGQQKALLDQEGC